MLNAVNLGSGFCLWGGFGLSTGTRCFCVSVKSFFFVLKKPLEKFNRLLLVCPDKALVNFSLFEENLLVSKKNAGCKKEYDRTFFYVVFLILDFKVVRSGCNEVAFSLDLKALPALTPGPEFLKPEEVSKLEKRWFIQRWSKSSKVSKT